jgi:Aspartyl protease
MRFLLCALIAAFFLPSSSRSEVLGEIPFEYRDGLIWLKVEVAGKKEPLNFLLDSGAGISALDLGRAHALGIRIGSPETVQGVEGQASAYRVNDLRAVSSGIDLPESVLAIDLRILSASCHQPIDGILGADFFRGRIVQIDFAASRVRLLKDCDLHLANCETLPIKMCNDAFCVPVRVAGNPAQWMRLDTGCDAALEWVISGIRRKRRRQPSIGLSERSTCSIRTDVRLGRACVVAVSASVHDKALFPDEAGLIGNGLLSRFRLTIDEPGSRVIFEKAR